jgi:hypothetical protein
MKKTLLLLSLVTMFVSTAMACEHHKKKNQEADQQTEQEAKKDPEVNS